jgi:prepilin-type N-terminal cleavage/methylation domain-containing protein
MTLLELLIVMAILGILFVMLLRTYNRISTMVFRVQQEKEVSQEILQVSQIVQNLADRNDIDYTKYSVTRDEEQGISLSDTD